MRIVFFGSGDFGVPALRWLANSEHNVVAVVTQPDRPAGRGKKVHPTPIAERAMLENFELFKCENVNRSSFLEMIRDLEADLGVVVDFGQKLKEPLRDLFSHGCINLHGSLLPKYRGAAPVAYAILQGETKTGVTVFKLVDQMDAGPILITRETMIGPFENQDELHHRLAGVACDALDAALKLYEADTPPEGVPQDESQATRAPKLAKSDGCLHFEESAEALARRCRAMTPWPGARCRFVAAAGKTFEVTLGDAAAAGTSADEPPGTITPVFTVATGAGTLEIHSLQPAGKRMISWHDFVNGRHVQPGDRFESLDH